MDQLKERIADAALHGAVSGIVGVIGGSHDVEVVTREPLQWQIRVRPKEQTPPYRHQGGPRYFTVKVAEPI